MATQRRLVLTDQGGFELLEDKANGTNRIIFQAPASLAGDLTMTLPSSVPTATEFLTMDSSGNIDHAAGSSGTLDQAYDSGGAGNGRTINADSGAVLIQGADGLTVTTGPVEISGAGGLQLTHTDPFLLFETTGVGDFNWRAQATSGDLLNFQRGDQDADVTDDTFEDVLTLDGANRRLGLNTSAPGTDVHVLGLAAADAKVTIEAVAGQDATVIFTENSTARFEVGYDDSRGGLVVGLGTIATDALFVEDATGDVGINEDAPDAKLHVTDSAQIVEVLESTGALCRLGLVASGTSDATQVGIQASGDDLYLFSNGAQSVLVGAGGILEAQSGHWTIAADGDAVFGDSADTASHSVTILAGSTSQAASVFFGDSSDATKARILYSNATEQFTFRTNGSTTARVLVGDEGLGIGESSLSPNGTNVIGIVNGTGPSSSLTDGVLLYAEDDTASSELKVRDEAGNITVLSPHAEPYGHQIEEPMGWSFYSERDGRYVWVDMLAALRELEHVSGRELIKMGETR